MTYHQLEISWVDLEPAKGADTKQKRPDVILQSNMMNKHSRTLIIAPLLPGHKNWPFVVNLNQSKWNGLDQDQQINIKQMRALDVSKMKGVQGKLEQKYLVSIHKAINWCLIWAYFLIIDKYPPRVSRPSNAYIFLTNQMITLTSCIKRSVPV